MLTPKDCLVAARKLIEDKERWCKHAEARLKNGSPCMANNPDATQWCAMGAVLKVAYIQPRGWFEKEEFWGEVVDRLRHASEGAHPLTVNDLYADAHTCVLLMFDKAI